MREEYVEAVRSVTLLIPQGRVLSYGDIAEILSAGGPRQVGAVLAGFGAGLPWWRVVRAGGEPPRFHGLRAWKQYSAEGTPLTGEADDDGGGYRVRMGPGRWIPGEADWEELERLRHRLADELAGGPPRGPAGPDSLEAGMSAGHDEVEP